MTGVVEDEVWWACWSALAAYRLLEREQPPVDDGALRRWAWYESGDHPRALRPGPVPTKGLLQLTDAEYDRYGVPDLGGVYDVVPNLVAGLRMVAGKDRYVGSPAPSNQATATPTID